MITPPLLTGAVHLIVIKVFDYSTKVGLPGVEGISAAKILTASDSGDDPWSLSAITLNLNGRPAYGLRPYLVNSNVEASVVAVSK